MTSSILRVVATCAALIVSGSAGSRTAAAETGDLWEVTAKVTMEGMPMDLPAQRVKKCLPKEWKEPPGGTDERQKCTNSDFKMDGPKATWKVACAGPPEMTGIGEITRGADTFAGAIQLTSTEVSMTIKLDGSRLEECTVPEGAR